jgi:magnesium transporter
MEFEVASVSETSTARRRCSTCGSYDELPGQTDALFVVDRDNRVKGTLPLNKLLVTNPTCRSRPLRSRRETFVPRATPTRRRRLSSATT